MKHRLEKFGYPILNDVVFNQILTKGHDKNHTNAIIEYIQQSGRGWVGGSKWHGEEVIRVSICSWYTTKEDIDEIAHLFNQAML